LPPIADQIRRFILNSIPSIPYLEAILLLRENPKGQMNANELSKRLFISLASTSDILKQLCDAHIVIVVSDNPVSYQYHPETQELKNLIDQLSEIYSKNLIEVTNLVHSNTNRKAHKFADAFLWKKDK
jgi:Mn-dependent DtxR family transcriptional regulator